MVELSVPREILFVLDAVGAVGVDREAYTRRDISESRLGSCLGDHPDGAHGAEKPYVEFPEWLR